MMRTTSCMKDQKQIQQTTTTPNFHDDKRSILFYSIILIQYPFILSQSVHVANLHRVDHQSTHNLPSLRQRETPYLRTEEEKSNSNERTNVIYFLQCISTRKKNRPIDSFDTKLSLSLSVITPRIIKLLHTFIDLSSQSYTIQYNTIQIV